MEIFNELLEQIYSSPYKKVTFSIFNFIENDGFIDELFCADKTRYGIDDFEYIKFSIDDKQKSGIKYSKREYTRYFKAFKECPMISNDQLCNHIQTFFFERCKVRY